MFGEFVGSTPCGEPFGKLFDIPADANPPVRWSLTLYQDPKTKAPTTYKVENSFLRDMRREGTWSVDRHDGAVVYDLAATKTEADLYLRKGDDNG